MCCHSSLGTGSSALWGLPGAFCVPVKECHWELEVGAGYGVVCCIFHCRACLPFNGSFAFFNPGSLFGDFSLHGIFVAGQALLAGCMTSFSPCIGKIAMCKTLQADTAV